MPAVSDHFDVLVVGGGIVGIGTAWAAAKSGAKTAVFEASPQASGATVRNFGMIWPIGQPMGERLGLALRARELWLELAAKTAIPFEKCGSLHLAHHEDEWDTLQEFVHEYCDSRLSLSLLSPQETARRTQAAKGDGLFGSMYSESECRVDARITGELLRNYLQSCLAVAWHSPCPIVAIEDEVVRTAAGQSYSADQIFVCTGSDLDRLYPEVYREAGLKRCKLQMLRTVRQPSLGSLGPHLASGLTLRHYEAFQHCPSQQLVRQRIAASAPLLDRFGIHVMLSQSSGGEIVLGDSHEYDEAIQPFDNSLIDELILQELRKVFVLPSWEIESRWHGIYAKYPQGPFWTANSTQNSRITNPRVTLINGFGGAGMTLALAATEQLVQQTLRS